VEKWRIPALGLVKDPRLGAPFWSEGGFWICEEATREALIYRVGIWTTPFGAAIKSLFARELSEGRAIRWDDERVAEADSYASRHFADDRRPWIEERRRELKAYRIEGEPPAVSEYRPAFVKTDADVHRWDLAATAAKKMRPTLGSARLLREATSLFRSDTPLEELERASARRRPSPRYRVSALGEWRQLHSS
jgi:hypothetical protein